MSMIIDGIDFENLEAEKYWSFPKTYKGDKQAETKTMILSGNYIGAEKKDGHYARFIKDMDGNMRLQGRSESVNGGYLDKIEWVPQCQDFFNSLPNGTVLLGELYFPTQRGSRKVTTILGCLKDKALERQEKGEKLHYYVFDIWAHNGKSLLDTPFKTRIEQYLDYEILDLFKCEDYVEAAYYYEGQELWDELGKVLNEGGEGVVITQKEAKAQPGKRTARKTLKVKMEIEQTVDVFIDGDYKPANRLYDGKEIESWPYWENDKTGEKSDKNKFNEYMNGEAWVPVKKPYFYGWASSISVSLMKDDKPVHVGWISNVPDEMKRDIIAAPEKYKYKVYELSCMEVEHIDGDYSFRHGKFVAPRPDKKVTDCTFDQIEQ